MVIILPYSINGNQRKVGMQAEIKSQRVGMFKGIVTCDQS